MTSSENPWEEVLSQPQQKTTDGITPYFNKQTKMLSEASGGKVKGLFSRTFVLTGLLSQRLIWLRAHLR